MQSLLKDFNIDVRIQIQSDATAAIGMARRLGLGRVRHLATADLWIQQRLREGAFSVSKLPGISNSADMMTKVKGRADIMKLLAAMGFVSIEGRPAISPLRTSWNVGQPVASPRNKDIGG